MKLQIIKNINEQKINLKKEMHKTMSHQKEMIMLHLSHQMKETPSIHHKNVHEDIHRRSAHEMKKMALL